MEVVEGHPQAELDDVLDDWEFLEVNPFDGPLHLEDTSADDLQDVPYLLWIS